MSHPVKSINWDSIVREARDCHSKQSWEHLFARVGKDIASANSSKRLQELFRLLKQDPQCFSYDESIWQALLKGCQNSWNLDLGREIAQFCLKIPSIGITISAAQIFVDSGRTSLARDIIFRASRLSNVEPIEKLQMSMILCSSYAEEGKHPKAKKILEKIGKEVQDPTLPEGTRADFLNHIGRLQFLLGQYRKAGEIFYQAANLFRSIGKWETAAVAIFNTAACYHNATDTDEIAFKMVEECKRLSESKNLAGPLAHCEAFYGTIAYHTGNFPAAREHFRQALKVLPMSDKGVRRLHILSMLANTYLKTGKFHLARRFGQQTLDLQALNESERFKTRYTTLEAELLWEDGQVLESQELLANETKPLETRGVQTLEELITLSRYHLQTSYLGSAATSGRATITPHLKNHTANYLDFLHSLARMKLSEGDKKESLELFERCRETAKKTDNRYQRTLALMGMTIVRLSERNIEKVDELIDKVEIEVSRLGETPLKTQVHLIHAARAYQVGDFTETERIIKRQTKSGHRSFIDGFVIDCFSATMEGRSFRLNLPWQRKVIANYTKTYFAPRLAAIDKHEFCVSGQYTISLERHPLLAKLLHYLMNKPQFCANLSGIQTDVWEQSLNSQGFRQKIRNSIMRLRDFFPYTLAPLILHTNQIQLFADAIDIVPQKSQDFDPKFAILGLLKKNPMSSLQLSESLSISKSTAKRILKRMVEESVITTAKDGRRVFYKQSSHGRPEDSSPSAEI
jgi:tetratricopeptide (TPR) repeat protein